MRSLLWQINACADLTRAISSCSWSGLLRGDVSSVARARKDERASPGSVGRVTATLASTVGRPTWKRVTTVPMSSLKQDPTTQRQPGRGAPQTPTWTDVCGMKACRALRLAHAPDLLVLIAVAIVRVVQVVRPTIKLDVVLGNDMHRGDVAAGCFAGECPIQLVDELPTRFVQRLCHSGDLVLTAPHPLESGHTPVAG